MQDSKAVTWRLALIGTALVLFGVMFGVYRATGNRPQPPSYGSYTSTPSIENPELIQNWLPQSAYTVTVARVRDYLKANGLSAQYITQTGIVDTNNGSYNFTLTLEPQNQALRIAVQVVNFNAILSTAVSINGILQGPNSPTQTGSTQPVATNPQYSGLDSLTNVGVTDAQMSVLKDALHTFAPSASSVSIDPASVGTIAPDPASTTTTSTFTFRILVDGTTYNGRLICTDISNGRLVLSDPGTRNQAFDSGV